MGITEGRPARGLLDGLNLISGQKICGDVLSRANVFDPLSGRLSSQRCHFFERNFGAFQNSDFGSPRALQLFRSVSFGLQSSPLLANVRPKYEVGGLCLDPGWTPPSATLPRPFAIKVQKQKCQPAPKCAKLEVFLPLLTSRTRTRNNSLTSFPKADQVTVKGRRKR